MAGAKILIVGLANTGKTSMVKGLKDTLVISRDGKPFPFKMPHVNVPDYDNVNQLLDLVVEKLQAYHKKFKKNPKTIVFDSVSRIFTDIETNCSRKFSGFEVWSNVNREVNTFVQAVNQMVDEGFNVIIISHCMWDEKAGKFIETCKGSFKNTGGFLSTVDYAINVEINNNEYWVNHRGNSLSRTLFDDMPKQQPVSDFSLQDYVDRIEKVSNEVADEWSL